MKKIEVNTSISYPFEVRKVNASKFESRLMPDEADVVFHNDFVDGDDRNYVSVKWRSPETIVPTADFIDELNRACKANGIASGTEVIIAMLFTSSDSMSEESKFSFEIS